MPRLNLRKTTSNFFFHLVGIAVATCGLSSAAHAENFATKTKPIALVFEQRDPNRTPNLVLTCAEYATATGDCSWFNFNDAASLEPINGTRNPKRTAMQAFMNWYPLAGVFHLSTGAFLGSNQLAVAGISKNGSGFALGSSTYAAEQIGAFSGDVELTRHAEPYVGFGWSRKALNGKIGFFADFGILFTSPAKTSLSATGSLANDPTFQSNLRKEENELSRSFKPLRYYPIAQLGLLFRF